MQQTKHPSSKRYPPEIRERAVRLVLEAIEETGERHGHVGRIARQLDIGQETLRIEILAWRHLQVVAVQAHPSPTRPHYLKREGPNGGVYVRVGSTNRRANRELVDELRRFARGETFDEQPMPGFDSEALDFRAASESFAGVRKLSRRDLATLRLVTDHQGRKVPTVGGMLLFGRDRERHFPDAWSQAGRFGGGDKSRIVDQAEIRSHPLRAIAEAVAFVAKHALDGAEIGAVRAGRVGTCHRRPCARRSSTP